MPSSHASAVFVRTFSATDSFDMSGTPFENVPKVTACGSVLYSHDLSNGRTLDLFGAYSYIGKIIFQDNTRKSRAHDQLTTPAYDRVNVSAALPLHSGLRFTLYVNNLRDSFDYTYASSAPFLGGDVFVVPLAPRQIGLLYRLGMIVSVAGMAMVNHKLPLACLTGFGVGFLVGASRLGAVVGPLLAGILLTANRNAGDVMLSLVPLIGIALVAALFLSGGRHVGQAIAE